MAESINLFVFSRQRHVRHFPWFFLNRSNLNIADAMTLLSTHNHHSPISYLEWNQPSRQSVTAEHLDELIVGCCGEDAAWVWFVYENQTCGLIRRQPYQAKAPSVQTTATSDSLHLPIDFLSPFSTAKNSDKIFEFNSFSLKYRHSVESHESQPHHSTSCTASLKVFEVTVKVDGLFKLVEAEYLNERQRCLEETVAHTNSSHIICNTSSDSAHVLTNERFVHGGSGGI